LGVGSVGWADAFWDEGRSWKLFEVAGTTSNFGNFTLTTSPASWLDSSGLAFSASSRSEGSFSVALDNNGKDVFIHYTVVIPEPSSLALAALGLAAAAYAVRCRQNAS